MADQVGVAKPTLSLWERGLSVPRDGRRWVAALWLLDRDDGG
jgi:hypothetical protein